MSTKSLPDPFSSHLSKRSYAVICGQFASGRDMSIVRPQRVTPAHPKEGAPAHPDEGGKCHPNGWQSDKRYHVK